MKTKIVRTVCAALVASATVFSGFGVAHASSIGGLTRTPPVRPGLHLVARRATLPPFGFAGFCENQSDQCEKSGPVTMVELSRDKRLELQAVNVQVNREINYKDDSSKTDEWRAGVSEGDCDDYALTKRQRLLRAGWPSSALRIATARTASGVGHAVLVVSTSEGDLVLDNRTNVVKPWYATQLRWIKIQSQEDPRIWLAL
ncbi:transglutaminase-like cysteine peptidase [Rhizobiaceae bacterium BDR2-2]|uniref:Transglutaminase-like cysteine peptidase n=1 Tax=Ectorhizobium quercum TaxID=2965071 RepID=A0AAE3N0Z0_9HYPH|nr:transglutaminase-like cysteine peptidase [Ectorhizobium quercum]MCX8998136.1 transglutaminase-like cysteine peptidase [Ectorhizobium quercum]